MQKSDHRRQALPVDERCSDRVRSEVDHGEFQAPGWMEHRRGIWSKTAPTIRKELQESNNRRQALPLYGPCSDRVRTEAKHGIFQASGWMEPRRGIWSKAACPIKVQ